MIRDRNAGRVIVALAAALLTLVSGACHGRDRATKTAGTATATADSAGGEAPAATAAASACPGDNGGLELPPGFCATVFADSLGAARDIAVAPDGDVFVKLMGSRRRAANGRTGGIVALRDTKHTGRADSSVTFGAVGGTGIAVHHGYLYADIGSAIVRYALPAGTLAPSGEPEVIVADLPTGGHPARNFTFDSSGAMYVNVGSATNSCQVDDRAKGSLGKNPCAELATRAGIWKFDPSKAGQRQATGEHFATGIRNAMGLAINPVDGKLYATQHGRDQLYQNWPEHFTAEQGAQNPAEELVQVNAHDDFGWPYCFFSLDAKKLVLAPEYGGDGKKVAQCASKKAPIAYFPGHWAPMSMLFYTGTEFPAKYRDGVFIAFHGSWNRAPEPQQGYKVVFVPMKNGAPSGSYVTFADGFAGANKSPDGAAHRPVGLAQAPDGSLFIADDKGGRVWRVTYTGR